MSEEIKQRVMQAIQKMWGGRASRLTFLLGVAIYVALISAIWVPAEMVQVAAPQLLWELYLGFLVAVTLASVLGICRLYVQRLHDMGMSGYWAIIALAVAPTALFYLSEEYASWRWQADSNFPTKQWLDATIYVILAGVVIFSLFRGSAQDNKFGLKPDIIALPQHSFQIRWMAIVMAAVCLPYFTYLGFFNDRLWGVRSESISMPMTSTNAPGRAFIRCWGFKGVSAYWNDKTQSKDQLLTIDSGFTKDGYDEVVFDLYIDDSGAIDIVTGGKDSTSYKEQGFNIVFENPNNIDLNKHDWYKSPSANTFMVTAVATNPIDKVQNQIAMSFVRTGEYGSYSAILTKNLISGSGIWSAPYIKGEVMIGSCS
jgi:uncharacterized membrane protein YhaH (DUF805 family)